MVVLVSAVLFDEHITIDGSVIVSMTLNSPESLNALNLDMIHLITSKLDELRCDERVVAIVIEGAGDKAFCAGGDIVRLYSAISEGIDQDYLERWFLAEYTLDYSLYSYPKPIICLGAGIVMGGGLGIMNGCSHRVVTESSSLAMPEVSIALYPDVGASWFLNQMPEGIGLFIGLTACRLNAADALMLSLADQYINSSQCASVIPKLCSVRWDGCAHQVVTSILSELGSASDSFRLPESMIERYYDDIVEVTRFDRLAEIVTAIAEKGVDHSWWRKAQEMLAGGSPLATAIIYQQLSLSREYTLKQVFESEMVLTTRCCHRPELVEGIRALLIDKDKKPNWMFSKLDDVDSVYVDTFFQSPWKVNPLSDELEAIDKKSAACR